MQNRTDERVIFGLLHLNIETVHHQWQLCRERRKGENLRDKKILVLSYARLVCGHFLRSAEQLMDSARQMPCNTKMSFTPATRVQNDARWRGMCAAPTTTRRGPPFKAISVLLNVYLAQEVKTIIASEKVFKCSTGIFFRKLHKALPFK